MPIKSFVFGSTGYIGNAVAKYLRVKGHCVYGLTRSHSSSQILARDEIIPVIGTMQNISPYKSILLDCDNIILAAADYSDPNADILLLEALELLFKNSTKEPILLYTSGCWIYGDTNGKSVSEKDPVDPKSIVSGRRKTELIILNSSFWKGIVIRPGLVYGRSGGFWAKKLFDSTQESVILWGNPLTYWSLVHVDSLASAYHLLLNKVQSTSGQIFNCSGYNATKMKIIKSCHAISGIKKYFFCEPKADLEIGMSYDIQINSSKLTELGWKHHHSSLESAPELYFKSFKAINVVRK